MEQTACPGCHFRCPIEGYQCGRGERLYEQWRKTGQLPERKRPGRGPQSGSPDERLLHALRITGMAVHNLGTGDIGKGRAAKEPSRHVVECLMQHEGAASLAVIEGRTGVADVNNLIDEGLVDAREGRPDLLQLTDKGLSQARVWETERKAAETTFLGVLAEDEKEQLLALVTKLLEAAFERGGN